MKGHRHHIGAGMVIGSRCNVCDKPLVVAGCPLCVTCCNRERLACGRCGAGNRGDHTYDCLGIGA